MCSTGYMRLLDENAPMHLLPVGPIHTHPYNQQLQPVYFSDVVVHADKKLVSLAFSMYIFGSSYKSSNIAMFDKIQCKLWDISLQTVNSYWKPVSLNFVLLNVLDIY